MGFFKTNTYLHDVFGRLAEHSGECKTTTEGIAVVSVTTQFANGLGGFTNVSVD